MNSHSIQQALEKFALILVGVALLYQFAGYATYLGQRAEPHHFVAAMDNDAGTGIQTTYNTRWWNTNNFHPYGTFYYRINHTFYSLTSWGWGPKGNKQDPTRHIHFVAMTTSLLSVYLVGLALAMVLATTWLWRGVLVFGFGAAVFQDPSWIKLVFRVHPDILATAMAVWCFYFIVRELAEPSRKYFDRAAMFFGICFQTKFLGISLIPAMIPFWYQRGEFSSRFFRFLKVSLGAYFLIGFPQSFLSLGPFLNFMLEKRVDVQPGSWESVANWVQLSASQIQAPLILLLAVAVLVKVSEFDQRSWNGKVALRVLAIATLPLIMLLKQDVLTQDYYYPIPFVAFLLFGIGAIAAYSVPSFPILERGRGILALAVLLTVPNVFPQSPVWPQFLNRELRCHDVMAELDEKVLGLQASGKEILYDPYSPKRLNDRSGLVSWSSSWELVDEKGIEAMILAHHYYVRYLDLTGTHAPWLKDPEATSRFYRSIDQKTELVDPKGGRWQRTHSDSCGFSIYLKTP